MNKNNSTIFNKFERQDEIVEYINRPEEEWREEKGRYDFEQCHFNYDVDFGFFLREFNEIVHFTNSTFNENVSFKGVVFKKMADFNGCVFKKTTSFKESIFEGDVNMSSFVGDVNFYKTKFNADTFFWKLFEGEANFAHSRFKNPTNFSKCVFKKNVKFHDAIFKSEANFNESEFRGKVNAWKMVFSQNVTFKWSDFRQKANFSQLKAIDGHVEFYGSNFESNAYFYGSEINTLDLKKSVIDKGLFFLGADINIIKRETARIIKNEFIKQNNKIEALKFHAKEMEAYKLELNENRIKKEENYSFWDYWILKLNRYSNNYGLSPATGIKFTLLVSLGWFILYFFSLKTYPITFSLDSTIRETFSSFGTVASHFMEFINPTHKANFIIDYTGSWSIFIDYFSRIFIGFGIYQLIQSFRKYGRL
jgi:uncharacterized protein YjbI with pentapeptide repeats